MSSLTKPIGDGDTSRTSTDDNIVVCNTVRYRGRSRLIASTTATRTIPGNRLVSQLDPVLIGVTSCILIQSSRDDTLVVVLHQADIIRTGRVRWTFRRLRPSQD